MFAAPRQGQYTEFRRQKLSGRFAPSCVTPHRKGWFRGLAAASLIVALVGIRSAHGDDSWSVAAPVIELDEEDRANSRSTLPLVVSKQKAELRPVSTSKIAAPVSRRVPAVPRSTLPLNLAPIFRGRPAWSKGSVQSQEQSGTIPAEIVQPVAGEGIRTFDSQTRSAVRQPAGRMTVETAPASVNKPKPNLRYGEIDELSEAVTIDLRDRMESIVVSGEPPRQRPAPMPPVPMQLDPIMLAPASLVPAPSHSAADESGLAETELPLSNPVTIDMSEHAAVPEEAIILGDPRTGCFWPDPSGRLLRAPALTTAPFVAESSLDSRLGERIAAAFAALTGPSDQSLLAQQPMVVRQPPNASSGPETVQSLPLPTQTIPQGPATADAEPPTDDDEIFRPIQQLSVDIAPGKGELPQNRAAIRFAKAGEQVHVTGFSRSEPETHFEWDAPALCHRPLFFEDVNLERHGYHVKYFQPLLSAAHFFSRVPALPYLTASQRSRVCNYTLGHYRPGSYAPYVWYYPQPSLTGTAIEGAVVTGLILAIP